jgi:hypothetical protein
MTVAMHAGRALCRGANMQKQWLYVTSRDLVNPYLDNLQIGVDRNTGAQLALPDATALKVSSLASCTSCGPSQA